jgi:hypothetical protein
MYNFVFARFFLCAIFYVEILATLFGNMETLRVKSAALFAATGTLKICPKTVLVDFLTDILIDVLSK